MIQKKKIRAVAAGSRARLLKPRTNLVLVSREQFLYLEFNKTNKQNVSEINLFKIFNFSQCQPTVDTLIDVRNETSKHYFLKTVKSIHHKPCFPIRMFLSVSGHSGELSIAITTAHGQHYPTLYQADLRITNHRRRKSPP